MYAVREGHIDVIRVLLDTESVDILAVNGVRYSVSTSIQQKYDNYTITYTYRKARLSCILRQMGANYSA